MPLLATVIIAVLPFYVVVGALCKTAHRADAELDDEFASRRRRVRR
jgi:hypothetical protein